MNAIISQIESPQPAKILRIMIQGLEEAEALEDFQIDMGCYGTIDRDREICFGCAATCTVMKIADVRFGLDDIGLRRTRLDTLKQKFPLTSEDLSEDLEYFEITIDLARCGNLKPLFRLCGMREYWKEEYNSRFSLGSNNWKQQVPLVEELAAEIEEDLSHKSPTHITTTT